MRTQGRAEPDREPFECQFLCLNCRHLDDEGQGECAACGVCTWHDLGLVEMTEFLRESEQHEQEAPPRWAKVAGWVSVAAVLVLATVVGIWLGVWRELYRDMMGYDVIIGLLAVTVGGFVVWIAAVSAPALAHLYYRWAGGLGRLDRWRIPLSASVLEPMVGSLESPTPLRSPLSDRECAAWLLVADLRAPGERRYRRVLVEHRSAALTINATSFEPDAFALDVRPRLVKGIDPEKMSRILRERGLLLADGDYRVREAVLPPTGEVSVTLAPGPGGTFSCLRPVRGKGPWTSGPYRQTGN